MTTQYTMTTIRQGCSGHFFDPDTMKFFGDTMQSFAIVNAGKPGADGLVRFKRIKPMRSKDGSNIGGVGTIYVFNPETGTIKTEKGG